MSRRTITSAALVVATGIALAPAITGVAHADDNLQCNSEALIFTVHPNGTLWLYPHTEPETGAFQWNPWSEVGSGWADRAFAGHDRRVYDVYPDGTLMRFRLTENQGWEDAGRGRSIGTGWQEHADPAFRNRVTVDSLGHFYNIDKAGTLHWRSYNETTQTWTSAPIATGWNQYDLITAAGNGVLYARKPGGELTRFRYHAPSQRWLDRGKSVGVGWQMFSRMFSPGGDVLYGIRPDTGQMLWYKYIESTGQMIGDPNTGMGKEVGTGWGNELSTMALTDNCHLTVDANPDRPPVTVNRSAAAALTKTSNGYLQYGYVDTEGRLVHGEVRDIYNLNPNGFSALPNQTNFTGVPSITDNKDGTLRIAAHGTDSDARGAVQAQPLGPLGGVVDFGGRMLSAPQLVRTADGLVTYVAVDKDGVTWVREQKTENGPLFPWRKPAYQLFGPTSPRPTAHVSAFASGNDVKLVALHNNGSYATGQITRAQPETVAWQNHGGTDGNGAAAPVTLDDGSAQLFVRRTDGKIYTHRSTANGTWTEVPAGELGPGVTTAGPPSAIKAPNGTLQVVVKGSDGFVYRTGQTAPGATTWLPWQEITGFADETGVDPSVSLAQDTWVVAFRTPDGNPKLRRFSPSMMSAASEGPPPGTFVDVPLSVN